MNPTSLVPASPDQADPSIISLMHGVVAAEGTNGNPNAIGDKGTAAGIGQWSNQVNGVPQPLQAGQIPLNFQNDAKQYGLNPNDFSIGNQNKVLYAILASDKAQGLTPEQALSKWNSGRANAYLTAPVEGSSVSATGTQDVADYVKRGMAAAQAYAQSQGGAPVTPLQNPSASASPSGASAPVSGSGGIPVTSLQVPSGFSTAAPVAQGQPQGIIPAFEGELGKTANLLNSFFPAVGDVFNDVLGKNKKTALQQAGDLGTTALSAGTIAFPGLGLADVGGAAGVGARIAANSALGAGFGATGAIGAGDTSASQIGQQALLGGAAGTVLGAGGEALGGVLGKFAAKTPESQLRAQTFRLKTLGKAFEDNSTSTTNPIKTLLEAQSENGKPLIYGLKVTDGKVNVSALTNETGTGSIDNAIEAHSQAASNLVKSIPGPGVPIQTFADAVKQDLQQDPTIRGTLTLPKALAALDSKMQSAQMSYGNVLPWTAVDEIRAGMNKVYDPTERDVARVIGDTSRKLLYNGDDTNAALKSAMQNESELIKARNFVQKIQGTSVPGGRLGRYFARLLGESIGSAAGTIGGPVGAAVGGAGGAGIADAIEGAMQGHYFNPIGSGSSRKLLSLLRSPLGGAAKAALLKTISSQGGTSP